MCAVATTKPDETAPPPPLRLSSRFVDICSTARSIFLPPYPLPFLLYLFPGVSLSKLIVLTFWLVVAFARLIHSTFHCITTSPLVPRMCSEYVCFVLPFSPFYSMPCRTGAKWLTMIR